MKRPVVLILGAAAGALLVAAVGASAHSGLSLTRMVGVHSSTFGDEASGARTETPEPSESPEASETPEAAPTAEPTQAPDNENEQGDNNDEQGDDHNGAPVTQPTGSSEHDDGGGGSGHDD